MRINSNINDTNRQATWLELFFDLVFVAVIDIITDDFSHLKHGAIGVEQIIHFMFSFVPLWWIWSTHTLFANRFSSNNIFYKTHTLLIMGMLIFLSASSSHSISHDFNFFVTIYCIIRVSLAIGYYTAYRTQPYKSFTGNKTICILSGASIAIASMLFKNQNTKMIIFLSGIICETIAHALVCHKNIIFPIHRKHLVERVGILTIIILGQTIVSLLAGIAHQETLNMNAIIAACASFLYVSSLWGVYFGTIHYLEKAKFMKNGIVLIYSHLLFYIGLIILACLVRHTILQDITRDSFFLLSTTGIILFYLGKQTSYCVYFLNLKLFVYIGLCTLVCIMITFISNLFTNTAYALLGMSFGMSVYSLLIKFWVTPNNIDNLNHFLSENVKYK